MLDSKTCVHSFGIGDYVATNLSDPLDYGFDPEDAYLLLNSLASAAKAMQQV